MLTNMRTPCCTRSRRLAWPLIAAGSPNSRAAAMTVSMASATAARSPMHDAVRSPEPAPQDGADVVIAERPCDVADISDPAALSAVWRGGSCGAGGQSGCQPVCRQTACFHQLTQQRRHFETALEAAGVEHAIYDRQRRPALVPSGRSATRPGDLRIELGALVHQEFDERRRASMGGAPCRAV